MVEIVVLFYVVIMFIYFGIGIAFSDFFLEMLYTTGFRRAAIVTSLIAYLIIFAALLCKIVFMLGGV